jgi:hypothetical protein
MLVMFLNAMFGGWLLISAFLWPHSLAQFHNAWIVGLLVTGLALASIAGIRAARYVNSALAVWLFISTVALPRASGLTILNNVLVAGALIVTSLLPEHLRAFREPART